MTVPALPVTVPVLRARGPHLSLDRHWLFGYDRRPLAEVHEAPPLLMQVLVEEVRLGAAAPQEPILRRLERIKRAGRLFGQDRLLGLTPEEYQVLAVQATGLPVSSVGEAFHYLTDALVGIEAAVRRQVPGGELQAADRAWSSSGQHAWVPLGRALGFGAPNNHPTVHLSWIIALALGWGVVVRPGSEDPLTPARLWAALAEAGFSPGRLAVAPSPHGSLRTLVEQADRSVLYGGDELVRRFAPEPRVLVNGPGRSKVFVDLVEPLADVDQIAAFLMEATLNDGGRKCTNASAVVVRGAPAQARKLAERLAHRMAEVLPLSLLDPDARLAVLPPSPFPVLLDRQIESLLGKGDRDLSRDARDGRGRVLHAHGGTFLLPTVVWCDSPASPLFGREYPFAFVTVTAVQGDPLPVLAPSLALTLLSRDRDLVRRALLHPEVLKVFEGPIPPWHASPGAPHQGRLADFLFASKAFRRAPGLD